MYRWLDGEPATTAPVPDPVALAADLADVLLALQAVDPTDGPQPGLHNWYRGGPLRTYDQQTQQALDELAGVVDTATAALVWAEALHAPWDGVDRWFHGDVAAGNLLLREGRLAALIDFGTCGVGDPACDLAVAWTLLDEAGRGVFRDRLGVDDATWARGRGWALWKALVTCPVSVADAEDAADLAAARRVVDAVLADAATRRRVD